MRTATKTQSSECLGEYLTETEVKGKMKAEHSDWSDDALIEAWDDFKSRREAEKGGRCVDLNVANSYKFWYATRQATSAQTSGVARLDSATFIAHVGDAIA